MWPILNFKISNLKVFLFRLSSARWFVRCIIEVTKRSLSSKPLEKRNYEHRSKKRIHHIFPRQPMGQGPLARRNSKGDGPVHGLVRALARRGPTEGRPAAGAPG